MSYESKMLEQLAMPTRKQVERVLLRTLFKHGGAIKEFGVGQDVVIEMADAFGLNPVQRSAFLETIYRKENRVKKSFLGIGCFFEQLMHWSMRKKFRDQTIHSR